MKALLIIRNFIFLSGILLSLVQNSYLKAMDTIEDTIDFFNVGQGHAVLVNKAGAKAPLLIDAGSLAHPKKLGTRYNWDSQDKASLASQISKRVWEIWRTSNQGSLSGKQLFLNIIITHPEEDHKNIIPSVLEQLKVKTNKKKASFSPNLLLGGTADQYKIFLASEAFTLDEKYKHCINYSENIISLEKSPGMFVKNEFIDEISIINEGLGASNCITHLFCPKGSEEDSSRARNSWSIVTRIQVNGMSALLTGDADSTVKRQMLKRLEELQRLEKKWYPKEALKTDILLLPHHGAEGTSHSEWDQLVDPRTIIIGSALKHNHPKGKALLKCLNLKSGRIWDDKVMAHGLQYFCKDSTHRKIVSSFQKKDNRLLDDIQNGHIEVQDQQLEEQWHVAWIDLPIYTLWTTGSLRFEQKLLEPKFLDAPHGLMGYIVVFDPLYYFSPSIRKKIVSSVESPESSLEGAVCDKLS